MRRGALHRFADLRLTCRSCLQAGRRALPEGARAHPPASRRHLEPRSRLWLWQRRRIGPVIRALDRATDPRHYWPRRARVFERPKQKLKRCDPGLRERRGRWRIFGLATGSPAGSMLWRDFLLLKGELPG